MWDGGSASAVGSEVVMISALRRDRELSALAERQMRMSALGIESKRRAEEQRAKALPQQLIHPYVAISREVGVDAGEIANLVAAKCNWKVIDREVLDYMAEHYHWSRVALEYVDEQTASWFHDTFAKWLDNQIVSQAEYVSRLKSIVLMAAQHESTVFVGRGVQFILPREHGLAVRVIAPIKQRISRIAERRQCSLSDAERFIHETDKGRGDFVRRYFHRDVADPHLYDVVLNLEYTPREVIADSIISHCRSRFGEY